MVHQHHLSLTGNCWGFYTCVPLRVQGCWTLSSMHCIREITSRARPIYHSPSVSWLSISRDAELGSFTNTPQFQTLSTREHWYTSLDFGKWHTSVHILLINWVKKKKKVRDIIRINCVLIDSSNLHVYVWGRASGCNAPLPLIAHMDICI